MRVSTLAVVGVNVCVGEVFLSRNLRVFRFRYRRTPGVILFYYEKDALIEFKHPCAWFQIYICLRL